MKHILIEKAYRYPEPLDAPVPENCTYSTEKGYWLDNQTGKPLMAGDDPRRPQTTKKCDRETGEDQKGE